MYATDADKEADAAAFCAYSEPERTAKLAERDAEYARLYATDADNDADAAALLAEIDADKSVLFKFVKLLESAAVVAALPPVILIAPLIFNIAVEEFHSK